MLASARLLGVLGLGAVTVIAAFPDSPPLVAVIVALPVWTACTRPLALTVAVAGALLTHVTVRPVSVPPAAFFKVTASWRVAPRATLARAGLTATNTTGATPRPVTVIPEVPPR